MIEQLKYELTMGMSEPHFSTPNLICNSNLLEVSYENGNYSYLNLGGVKGEVDSKVNLMNGSNTLLIEQLKSELAMGMPPELPSSESYSMCDTEQKNFTHGSRDNSISVKPFYNDKKKEKFRLEGLRQIEQQKLRREEALKSHVYYDTEKQQLEHFQKLLEKYKIPQLVPSTLEKDFQMFIMAVIRQKYRLEVDKEVSISKDSRVDIFVPQLNLYIECKVGNNWAYIGVQEQIRRYIYSLDEGAIVLGVHPVGKFGLMTPGVLFDFIKNEINERELDL